MLPELLSRTTRIPVLQARNEMKIAPNHIYVMPSNVNIEITDGHFVLTPRTKNRLRFLPVDTFMQTLAEVGVRKRWAWFSPEPARMVR